MIYTFSNLLFEELQENDLDLLDTLWNCSRGRHFLFIGNLSNLESIKQSNWYISLRQSNKDQIDQQFIASAQLGKNLKKTNICKKNSTHFSLEEAIAILCNPLTIILENIENDANFINAIIKCYAEGKEIDRHYKNGWLVYTNGGGNNIQNVINGMKRRFEENKSVFPKNSTDYLRVFVIIDSDKKFPSQNEVAADKVPLLDFIKKNTNNHYHVMLKREMENYLPSEIFAEIPNNEAYKKAYFNLSDIQKDFFDLEKGFPDKNFDQLDEEIQNLYSAVNKNAKEDADAKKLFRKGGFVFYKTDGKKDNFKAQFPSLFLSKNITKSNLEKRAHSTNPSELKEILQKINDLL